MLNLTKQHVESIDLFNFNNNCLCSFRKTIWFEHVEEFLADYDK